MGLAGNQSLNYHILYIRPYLFSCLVCWVLTVTLDVIEDSPKTSLVSNIVLVRVFIEYEVITILVDGIVCQMHAEIP